MTHLLCSLFFPFPFLVYPTHYLPNVFSTMSGRATTGWWNIEECTTVARELDGGCNLMWSQAFRIKRCLDEAWISHPEHLLIHGTILAAETERHGGRHRPSGKMGSALHATAPRPRSASSVESVGRDWSTPLLLVFSSLLLHAAVLVPAPCRRPHPHSALLLLGVGGNHSTQSLLVPAPCRHPHSTLPLLIVGGRCRRRAGDRSTPPLLVGAPHIGLSPLPSSLDMGRKHR